MDFKDISTVEAKESGKQQHAVEAFNFVDAGTSILLDAQVQADFPAQTALQAVVHFLQRYGVPPKITFDRDPRFVGSATGGDFPSPLIRFLLCLGIEPHVCPPHRPDQNACVERSHRSYNQECVQVHFPRTREQLREVTQACVTHYHTERPKQALSCGNQPPCVAFPELPNLPPLPQLVDPDAWLPHVHGKQFVRKVRANSTIRIDDGSYYIHMNMVGQYVDLCVDAHQQIFVIWHRKQVRKQVLIKGLQRTFLPSFRAVCGPDGPTSPLRTTSSITSPTGDRDNKAVGKTAHPPFHRHHQTGLWCRESCPRHLSKIQRRG